MLEAKTLIGHCILLKKAMNMKIDGIIYGCVALYSVVISLDSNLACQFYQCLSEELSTATQKEEHKLHTSRRNTNFVELK